MRVLVACEYSGIVRDCFASLGHDAMSCDLLPTEKPGPHYQGNVFDVLDDGWDLLIAHPPCTYLSLAGACRMYPSKGEINHERLKKAMEAKEFFLRLLNHPIPKICIENPRPLSVVGLPPESQVIQPWMFGDPYTKRTHLWLKNLPKLVPTDFVKADATSDMFSKSIEPVPFLPSGTSRKLGGITLGAAKRGNDSKNRSATFPGVALAMAQQWGIA